MAHLKNILIGILFLAALIFLVCWLARSSITPHPTSLGKEKTTTTIRLRFGHNSPVDSALHVAAQKFADEVRQKSLEKVQITVHPFQELGNDDQMLEMARQGKLDIILTPTAKMSVAVPAMQYADLPFYFPSREILYRMLDGEPGRLLLEKLRPIGLEGIAFWENGFKHFTANRPIHNPKDFKGLKIRTMKSRIIMHHFEEMGATPILIDFHATRQALADKVVDGEENPLVAIAGMKFYEVQSHLTLSSHGYLGYVLAISGPVFQNLDNDVRSLLAATGRELIPFERAETQRRETQFLETIRQAGVTIHTLTDAERNAFTKITAHFPRQYESIIGSDIISKTEEFFRSGRAKGEIKREIAVGFDSDLSAVGIQASLGIKQGALLAMEEINLSGGVLGNPLVLLSRDNKAVPSVGEQNFIELASIPEVVAIMGGMFSNISEMQSREAQQLAIPYLVPWAAAAAIVEHDHDQEPNFTFRISANDRLAGPFLAGAAIKQIGKVALILENSSWGRGNYASMSLFLEKSGQPSAHVTWFNRGETHWSPILDAVRKSGAQGIVLVANSMEGAAMIKTMISDSHRGEKLLPIISHWGIIGGDFPSLAGSLPADLDLKILQTFSLIKKNEAHSQYVLDLYNRFFHPVKPGQLLSPVGTAQAYDLIHLLAKAIAKAGTTDRTSIRTALESLENHSGLVKHYTTPFTPERHDALDEADYFLARFNSEGQLIPVDR